MKFYRISVLIACVFTIAFIAACSGKSSDTITPFRKFSDTGRSTQQQKVNSKATRAAQSDGVLLSIEPDSVLKSAATEGVAFTAKLKVNNQLPIFWSHTFKLKVGESLDAIQLDDSHGLGDYNLSLSVKARRIVKKITDKSSDEEGTGTDGITAEKNPQGYLVLQYELKQIKNENELAKKSYLLAIVDLSHLKSTKPLKVAELIYPVPDHFLLEEWIDKNLK